MRSRVESRSWTRQGHKLLSGVLFEGPEDEVWRAKGGMKRLNYMHNHAYLVNLIPQIARFRRQSPGHIRRGRSACPTTERQFQIPRVSSEEQDLISSSIMKANNRSTSFFRRGTDQNESSLTSPLIRFEFSFIESNKRTEIFF